MCSVSVIDGRAEKVCEEGEKGQTLFSSVLPFAPKGNDEGTSPLSVRGGAPPCTLCGISLRLRSAEEGLERSIKAGKGIGDASKFGREPRQEGTCQ